MLRKRSRAVTGKQGTGGDQSTLPWLPPEKSSKPTSFFKGFFTISSETDATMSPTSILANTFFPQKIQPQKTISENKHSWEQPNNSKGIGIALVDTEKHNTSTKQKQKQQQERKLVVFGSQLRIHVPPSSVFHSPSPESEENPERQNMSMTDIEQSEDYTCVISHGPNPKTTHIFGNCVVQSCCGVDGNRNGYLIPSMQSFLSFCHQCKKQLGEGKDIYMYRGEKAFCSEECRCQGMLLDRLES